MNLRALAGAVAVLVAAGTSPPLAADPGDARRGTSDRFESRIDRPRVERAIALARGGDPAALDRFHQPYLLPVDDPLLRRLEIVTEFRRVVLAAEERVRFGDATWGLPQALALLAPFRGTVSLVLHVRFPPQNTYRAMPAFALVLYPPPPASGAIAARDVRQVPRDVAGQLAPPGSPILAGSIEATFDASRLDPRGPYLVGISEEGRELRRVPIDFARIE